eukprot:1601491-Rhodomonas_salina.1
MLGQYRASRRPRAHLSGHVLDHVIKRHAGPHPQRSASIYGNIAPISGSTIDKNGSIASVNCSIKSAGLNPSERASGTNCTGKAAESVRFRRGNGS